MSIYEVSPLVCPKCGPTLWELRVTGQAERETDPQSQPAPDYAAQQIPFWDEFDQRVAW